MQSQLFDQANLEVRGQQRFALQNPQMVRVHLGGGGRFKLAGLLD